MPITPFHFGPGALLHAIAPRHVSFLGFCAANGVMDLEPVYLVFTGQFPLHRFMHTITGASCAWLIVVAGFVVLRRIDRRWRLPDWLHWKALTPLPVAIGAAAGAYSHLVLDGIMHGDMFPFLPLSRENPLLHAVSLETLHLACLTAGLFGLGLLALRRWRGGRERNGD
ncbi:hypothetical protein [Arenimonas sp.]|uniref:hypothetical protein n=1 Tax=Arenimonas sp. TaxID=1872635 RepID=UPI0039E2E3D1